MVDRTHKLTDVKLADMEKHLSAIYARKQKEVGESWKEFLEESTVEIQKAQKTYNEVKSSGDYRKIKRAEKELIQLKKKRTLQNKRFRDLSEQAAEEISRVNETAQAYVNNELPEVYAMNYNALPEQIGIEGYSFTLTDANTVKNLIVDNPDLLPLKSINSRKDILWNKKKINAEVLQGILQGESMDKIAERLQTVTDMNYKSAIRTARTAVTSAECKGRLDSYVKAEQDGIILKKEWMATNDGRTRHAHQMLNGQQKNQDEPFESELGEIMYPGDPSANPANVFN